jgi:hypothetical protein
VSKVKKTASLTGVRNLPVPAPKAKPVARAKVPAQPVKAPAKPSATKPVRKPTKVTAGRRTAAQAATATAKKPVKQARRPTKAAKKIAKKIAKKSSPKAAPGRVVRGTRKAVKKTGRKVAAKSRKTVTLTVVRGQVKGRPGRLEPIARYAIKPLDPLRKCGPETSVQFLYRVDESVEGRTTPHLVFFDRHGWYCEHGRTCPAVAQARKYNGHIARVS